MKHALGLAFIVFSMTAFAYEVFRPNTILPSELQAKVLKAVSQRCSQIYGLSELATRVERRIIDQGQIDFHYFTTFEAQWYFDGMHPVRELIEVESAELAIYNPAVDRLPVISVQSEACN